MKVGDRVLVDMLIGNYYGVLTEEGETVYNIRLVHFNAGGEAPLEYTQIMQHVDVVVEKRRVRQI